jgi:hypothetical protein
VARVCLHACRAGLLVILTITNVSAQVPAPDTTVAPPRQVHAARVMTPIILDGRLDEALWSNVEPARQFTQRNPNEGQPETETTEVRFLYDEDALYVGARMLDREPGRIGRRLSRRDASVDGLADTIVINLDPMHDRLTGSCFRVSAAGALYDAVLYNDSSEDDSWDGVWEAKVVVDDKGWTAEMRIPFSQLRFKTADHQEWGLNIVRTIQRSNEEDWWVPVPKQESGFVSRMGTLAGLEGIRARRHFALLPYATTRGEFTGTTDEGDPFNDGSRMFGGLGLDAKWGVTSNLTIDATVNPDFGQVEVDPAVVNLSVFETYYEEKRPFFIEGSQSLTNFGLSGVNGSMGFNRSRPTLFYSRRIGRAPQGNVSADFADSPAATTILGAAKLSGKTAAGWTIGVLDAVTSREWADLASGTDRSRSEVEPLTNYVVARLRRDVGQRAGFGFMTTAVNRDLRNDALGGRLQRGAYVYGIDGHAFLDAKRTWAITSGLAGSYVTGSEAAIARLQRASARYYQRPDANHIEYDPTRRSLSGWDFQLDLNRNSGNFRPNVSLWAVSPGFESNDIGYMTSADRRGGHIAFLWRKPTPDALTRDRHVYLAKFWAWNFAGDKTTDGVWSSGYATLLNYWSVQGTAFLSSGVLNDRLTRGGPMMWSPRSRSLSMEVDTDSRKSVTGSISGEYDTSVSGTWSGYTSVTASYKPTPSLSFEAGPSWTRTLSTSQYVTNQTDATATATYGSRYVFGSMNQTEVAMTLRANLIFSPRMSLQFYAQPLLSTGHYSDFKEAGRPRTYSFLRYGAGIGSIAYDNDARIYSVSPSSDGSAQSFSFGNPDFNYKSLRVNAVYRWEFTPGSTVYLVWTQAREDYARPGQFALGSDLSSMFSASGNNVVMAKVSYWFGR